MYMYNMLQTKMRVCSLNCVYVSIFEGCRMGRSDKVSLWYVALLINTRFRFFILE